jgi:hypothetical protein
MSNKLFIENNQAVRDGMTLRRFNWDASGAYHMDEWIMDHLDIAEECPEGYRPATIHIVPYTIANGQIVYWAFSGAQLATVYSSLLIEPVDFVARDEQKDRTMSFCKTVIGKILRVLDQHHISLRVKTNQFHFPAVIDGEVVWAVEIKASTAEDEKNLIQQLGTPIGQMRAFEFDNPIVQFDSLSIKIVNYKKDNPSSKDMMKEPEGDV